MKTENIKKALDRPGRWSLLIAWAVALSIALFLNADSNALRVEANIPGGILGYEISGTAERFRLYEDRILQAGLWDRLVIQLVVDYAFILAYVAALWGSTRALSKFELTPDNLTGPLSFACGWVLLAGGLDALENSCLLAAPFIETGTFLDVALVTAAVAAVFKFILIFGAMGVLAVGLGCVVWRLTANTGHSNRH